jgi:threonine aldolase
VLQQLPWVQSIEPVETNILIFAVKPEYDEVAVMEKLRQKSIYISSLGKGKLRIVTHLDYKEVMHNYVLEALERMVL